MAFEEILNEEELGLEESTKKDFYDDIPILKWIEEELKPKVCLDFSEDKFKYEFIKKPEFKNSSYNPIFLQIYYDGTLDFYNAVEKNFVEYINTDNRYFIDLIDCKSFIFPKFCLSYHRKVIKPQSSILQDCRCTWFSYITVNCEEFNISYYRNTFNRESIFNYDGTMNEFIFPIIKSGMILSNNELQFNIL